MKMKIMKKTTFLLVVLLESVLACPIPNLEIKIQINVQSPALPASSTPLPLASSSAPSPTSSSSESPATSTLLPLSSSSSESSASSTLLPLASSSSELSASSTPLPLASSSAPSPTSSSSESPATSTLLPLSSSFSLPLASSSSESPATSTPLPLASSAAPSPTSSSSESPASSTPLPLASSSALPTSTDAQSSLSTVQFGDARLPHSCANDVKNPVLPYTCSLDANFTEIRINGSIKSPNARFGLDLHKGCCYPNNIIPFHFKLNHEILLGQQENIALDTYDGKKWISWQKLAGKEFFGNKNFLLVIRQNEAQYQVFVNGLLLTEHKKRLEPSRRG